MDKDQDVTSVRVLSDTLRKLNEVKEARDSESLDDLLNDILFQSARVAMADDEDLGKFDSLDQWTLPLRREAASLEREMSKTDTPFDERVEELKGQSPHRLRARVNRLSRERLHEIHGGAFLPEGEASPEFWDLSENEKIEAVNDLAREVLTARELKAAKSEDVEPRTYILDHYGLRCEYHPSADALQEHMSAVRTGPNDLPARDNEQSPEISMKDVIDN